MIIEWTKENVKIIPITGKNKAIVGEITLLPGFNEVSEDEWQGAEPHVRDQVQRGIIKVVETKPAGNEKAKPAAFADVPDDEALAMIAETNVIKTLTDWRKSDERPEIRHAIQERIGEIRDKKQNQASEKE